MQIGSRWAYGAPPHTGVPEQLYSAIEQAERLYPESHSWTLTWLEGRPRCMLDALVEVTIDAAGDVRTEVVQSSEPSADSSLDEEDDDWLS